MKRIFAFTLLVALLAAAIGTALPVRAGANLSKLKACSIYEVYSYKEAGYSTVLDVGNFSAVTTYADPLGKTGGQTNWVQLQKPEIDFIKAINKNSLKPWAWADSNVGTIYLGAGLDDYVDTVVKWPRIILSSNETGVYRNQVYVLERSVDGRLARIQGIPLDSDYTQYTAFPWLFNTAYTVFPTTPGVPNRTGEVPLYIMPIWDPASGFKVPDYANVGIWVSVKFLARKIGEFNPAAPTPTSFAPTETPLTPTPIPTVHPAFEMRVLDRNGKLLSVRNEPSMNSLSIGGLYPNAIIYVEDLKYGDDLDPQSIWGRLGDHAWIAICFRKTLYTNFGCAPVR